jgi:hypothetical protein
MTLAIRSKLILSLTQLPRTVGGAARCWTHQTAPNPDHGVNYGPGYAQYSARKSQRHNSTDGRSDPTVALLMVDLCLVTAVDSGLATMTFVPW